VDPGNTQSIIRLSDKQGQAGLTRLTNKPSESERFLDHEPLDPKQLVDTSCFTTEPSGPERFLDSGQCADCCNGLDIMINTMSVCFTGSVSLAQESTNDVPCCWGFTFKQLCEAQRDDNNFQIIISFLKNKTEPTEGALFRSSPEAKYFWINKEMFKLADGVVFRYKPDSNDLQFVVPVSLQQQAIEWHHDVPFSGL